MPGNSKTTPAQAMALNELIGLVGQSHVGGRTLCCLIGAQGTGKTWLAQHMTERRDFGKVRYISVNDLILNLLAKDPVFVEVFDFNATTIASDLKRYGSKLRSAVHDLVSEQVLPEGLTILDHLELVIALGLDPITIWYNDAVGKRRILLVLTGRMAGQLCLSGQHTLTRGDQPIVQLEA